MPKIEYKNLTFRQATLDTLAKATNIIDNYQSKGYTLTVRQLYYQLVARGFVENTMRSYNRIVDLLSKARLAGLVDWYAIEDRTRRIEEVGHWGDPGEIIQSAVPLWCTICEPLHRTELAVKKVAAYKRKRTAPKQLSLEGMNT